MSKKLMAVATAAALALSALVAAPAQASSFSTTINNANAVATAYDTAAKAFIITDAMESGTLDYNTPDTGTTGTVARFSVTTVGAATLSVTTTGGVKLTESTTDSAGDALKIGAGTATLSKAVTAAANKFTFFAYTNSTTAGSVIVDSGTTKVTYFIKAKPGTAQNVTDVKFPSSVLSDEPNTNLSKNLVTFQITDAFGNKLDSLPGTTTATLTVTGGLASGAAAYNNDTGKKYWNAWVHGKTQSSVSMQLKLALTSTGAAADLTAAGFPAAKDVAFSTVSAGSLADQVKTLTAQVATLQAALAATVTKAKFNKLAKRWNRANPSNKVKLVK
jgi:hypothetical protein